MSLIAGEIAQGNLLSDMPEERVLELEDLRHSFLQMTGSLREIIAKVIGTAESVAIAADTLAAAATEMEKVTETTAIEVQGVASGSKEQAEMARNILANIERMLNNVEETNTAADTVGKTSIQMVNVSKQNIGEIIQAADSMNNAQQTVEKIAERIYSLDEMTKKIGEINAVITGLAGQTNLLALNAAIEAARAGMQGKGFAVVADEVRKLAEQSEAAASEISKIVSAVQKETGAVVAEMERGSKEVIEGVAKVNQSIAQFDNICQAIEKMRSDNKKVLTLAKQQKDNSVDTENRMQAIISFTRKNVASIEEVAAASQEQAATTEEIGNSAVKLAELAGVLRENVRRFKV